MFVRVLRAAAVAAGLVWGAIGVLVLPLAVPGWAGLGLLVGALVCIRVRDTATRGGAGPVAPSSRAGVRDGVLAGTVTFALGLALTGVAWALGPVTGTLALALVLAAAPLGWRWWRRDPDYLPGAHAAAKATPAAATEAVRRQAQHITAAIPAQAAQEVSIRHLCLAWQRSYFVLLEVPGPARGEIVALRAGLLDEMERRDPDGFTRWLDNGPRPSSDPGRYLTTDHTTDH